MNAARADMRWLLGGLLGWALIVAWLLFSPAPELPSGAPYSDKLGHLGIFALAGAWVAWHEPVWPRAWPWLLVLMVYAGFTELVQHQLPTRSAELADGLADGLGLVLGFAALRSLRLRQRLFA